MTVRVTVRNVDVMETHDVCCEAFAKATQGGTDNEGYGRLIDPWGGWVMGVNVNFNFCPWCGKSVADIKKVADKDAANKALHNAL